MTTYGERIEQEVKSYKSCHKTLVEVGNKKPKMCILGEVKMKMYVWERVLEKLEKSLPEDNNVED
jgi:hypothetical protein